MEAWNRSICSLPGPEPFRLLVCVPSLAHLMLSETGAFISLLTVVSQLADCDQGPYQRPFPPS